MRRYRITVDQAAIRDDDPNPIIVHDRETDKRTNCSDVGVEGRTFFRTSAGEMDGARVFAETDALPIMAVSGQVVRSSP